MSVSFPRSATKNVKVSLVHALNNQEFYDFGFTRGDGEFKRCKFVDDYGFSTPHGWPNAKLFIVGNEYGYTHIVHAENESDAHSAALDEMHTIEESEVSEAYNSYDKLLERMEIKGYENDLQLRCFCTRWADFFFHVDAELGHNWGCWELDEAYQYQSNLIGTGIVNVGHYRDLSEIKWEEFTAVRKVGAE